MCEIYDKFTKSTERFTAGGNPLFGPDQRNQNVPITWNFPKIQNNICSGQHHPSTVGRKTHHPLGGTGPRFRQMRPMPASGVSTSPNHAPGQDGSGRQFSSHVSTNHVSSEAHPDPPRCVQLDSLGPIQLQQLAGAGKAEVERRGDRGAGHSRHCGGQTDQKDSQGCHCAGSAWVWVWVGVVCIHLDSGIPMDMEALQTVACEAAVQVYTYIHAYIYTHTHTHTHMYIYVHTYIHTHTHTYIYNSIHLYV